MLFAPHQKHSPESPLLIRSRIDANKERISHCRPANKGRFASQQMMNPPAGKMMDKWIKNRYK